MNWTSFYFKFWNFHERFIFAKLREARYCEIKPSWSGEWGNYSFITDVGKSGPCSTLLSTKFILLVYVKMPSIVGILTFICMINTTSERLKARKVFICRYLSSYEQLKFRAHLSWEWKEFYNLGVRNTRTCMSYNAISENKNLAKSSESTVYAAIILSSMIQCNMWGYWFMYHEANFFEINNWFYSELCYVISGTPYVVLRRGATGPGHVTKMWLFWPQELVTNP